MSEYDDTVRVESCMIGLFTSYNHASLDDLVLFLFKIVRRISPRRVTEVHRGRN